MPHHIFFSWQSDTPNGIGRTLIQRALEEAIETVANDTEVDPADRALAIDRDTAGVPGSPPLVETIFGKIDRAAAFVSDLTYVAARAEGQGVPNPNVLLEHGWAMKSLSWRRVIAVMNTAFGHPEKVPLPFDLQHFRRPILYELADDASGADRRAAREQLTRTLIVALKAILADDLLRAAQLPPLPADPHPHDLELLARVRRQFPEKLQRFLHLQNFGDMFRRDQLEPIHEMNENWLGAPFEFHDPALQGAFAELRARARAFGDLINHHIFAMDNDLAMGSPKTDLDRKLGTQRSTLAAIDAMNTAAASLCGAIDGFERVARDRIRVALPQALAAAPDNRAEEARALLDGLAQAQHRGEVPVIVSRPKLVVRIAPHAATEGRRIDPRQVAAAQLRFPPDANVRVVSDSDGRQWWSADPPRRVDAPNPEARWLARLVRPGVIEYQMTVGDRTDDDPEIVVDGRGLERDIVETIERLGAALADLGLAGPAAIGLSLEGTEDVILQRARPGGRKIGAPQVILPVADIADLGGDVAGALHEQFDILWQSSGWPDGSPSFGGGAWDGRGAAT